MAVPYSRQPENAGLSRSTKSAEAIAVPRKTVVASERMARLTLKQPEPQSDPVDDALAFVGGMVLGAIVAGLCAIFLAPTDGQTLRRRILSAIGLGEPEPLGAADEPLLTPRDVPTEEGVAQERAPVLSH